MKASARAAVFAVLSRQARIVGSPGESDPKTLIEALRRVIKRLHDPVEIMLVCVRWCVAYPLSLRHLEEMTAARGVRADHSTIHRWAMKVLPVLPVLAAVCRRRKRPVGKR